MPGTFFASQHAAERQILRHGVMHLGHVLEARAGFADHLVVHVHHDIVVFAMDHTQAVLLRDHLEHLPDVAEIHHAPAAAGRDVGGKHFYGRITRAQHLGELPKNLRRQRALDHYVKAVVTLALARPIFMPVVDGLLDSFAVRPAHEVDHRRRAAIQRRAAHHRRRIGVGHAAVGVWRIPFQMHMRIDAAGHDDFAGGIDQAFGGVGAERSGGADGNNFFALYRQITGGDAGGRHHPVAANHYIKHT